MQHYLKMFLYILGKKRSFLPLLASLSLLNSFLDYVGFGLIGPFMAFAINPEKVSENNLANWLYIISGLESKTKFISILGIAIISIFYIKSVLSFFNFRYINDFSFKHQGDLREKLLHAYLIVPYTFHLKQNTSKIIQNIIDETHNFCHGILIPSLLLFSNGALITLLVILLARVDLGVSLIIAIILLLIFVFYSQFRPLFARWGREASDAKIGMIQVINHSLGSLKETRVIGCELYFKSKIHQYAKQYTDSATAYHDFNIAPRLLVEALLMTCLIGVLSITLYSGQKTQNLIPTLGVFALTATRLLPSFTHFMSAFSSLKTYTHTLERLYLDLKELENVNNAPKHLLITTQKQKNSEEVEKEHPILFQNNITLDGLTYRYPDISTPAIEKLSLNLAKGESIALIGKSGAGKTTLVDIILGLLSPESGDIKVDGQSIYKNLRGWQDLIGYIPQSIFLMDDSIEGNIAFGVENHLIDQKRLQKAIHAAQLGELIEQLPNGIHTVLGERGVRLSGGQRQRVGIARALYHEREILILDEATSALDKDTEQLVNEAIRALSGTKTMIIIAHRLTTVEHCDRVYVLEQGQVVRSGSYQEVVLR